MQGLIIEDSPLTASVVKEILRLDGYSVLVAHNGQEGLHQLEEVEEIDFVISDFEMPEMDGLSFLEKIRERVEWETLPFILLTSRADVSTVQKAAALGCKHFLVKPPDDIQLRKKIHDAIEDEGPVLLPKAIVVERFKLTSTTYEKILEAFVQEIKNSLHAIERVSSNGKFDDMNHAILNLQEGANILGATRLEKQFAKLPKGDTENESYQIKNRLPAFIREIKALHKVLSIRWHPQGKLAAHR